MDIVEPHKIPHAAPTIPSSANIDSVVMAAVVAIGGAASIAYAERIGINAGQGWDGISYTQWAQNIAKTLHDGLTRYHSQRILPSAVVSLFSKHDVPHVLTAFAIMNVAVCTGAAFLWGDLARFMKWSRPAAWAGFVGLFCSFAIAKHAVYYPALTDPTAFALGMGMIWAYLRDRPVVLTGIALASMLTWPALTPLALIMLIVPRVRRVESTGYAEPSRRTKISATALGIVAAATFIITGLHYLAHPLTGVGDEKFAQWVLRPWLVLTLPLLSATIVLGLYYVISPVSQPVQSVRSLNRHRLYLSIAAAVTLYIARSFYLAQFGTRGEGPTGAQFLCEHTLAALRGPLWGIVAHFVYFGPVVAVGIVVWKRIGQVAWSWGPAASLGLMFIVMFAAGSNSRQWSHLVPLLVALCIAATNAWWTRGRVFWFAMIALIWSKVWLHLGYDSVLDWHEFPNQRYFMNTGPYSADRPYVVHFLAAAITLLITNLASRFCRVGAPE